MAPPDTSSARQAALLLHGLSSGARQRVLAKLDMSEATQLRVLLAELAELGVPAASSQQLGQLAAEVSRRAPIPAGRALSVQEQVDSLRPEVIAHCLKRCSGITVALLLSAHAWSWKQQVLDRLSELRRAEVLRHMRAGPAPIAPAVLTTLYQRLCAEAETARVPDEPALQREPVELRGPRWSSSMAAKLRRCRGWMR